MNTTPGAVHLASDLQPEALVVQARSRLAWAFKCQTVF